MKPELKAYQLNTVNLDNSNESIQRGYVLEPVYGKTEHEARRNALKVCYDHGIEETWADEPLEYVNIRIKRFKDYDKFLVDGKLKTKQQIEYDQRVIDNKNNLKNMLVDFEGQYAYIRKGGYYYCSGFCGYTERQENAGVYTIEQAVNECLYASIDDYMRPILINVEQHNKMLRETILRLESKIIK